MEAAAAHLLNLEKPFDCSLLDQIVLIAMDPAHTQRAAANEFLVRMKDHPDMWRRADAILETSKQASSKFFALQVLGDMINTHWKVITPDERDGIRSYVVSKIIALSSTDELMRENSMLLQRLNLVLVQILKQDWPHNWPTFITDIVGSSKTSESLCENNMKVLTLLSEDVFDFSKDTMTTAKIKSMKESLNEEFAKVFQLCEFILGASTKPSLLRVTLHTLQRFLSWIPLGYIFETNLIGGLISKFLPAAAYRVATLDCLIEIASLPPADIPESYREGMVQLLVSFVQTLYSVVPREEYAIREAYENGLEEECLFVQRLALFLGTYLKSYLPLFEIDARAVEAAGAAGVGVAGLNSISGAYREEAIVLDSIVYMVRVTEVQDEEVFKTCLEFWNHFARELYAADVNWKTGSMGGPGNGNGSVFLFNGQQHPALNGRPRHVIFDSILHSARVLMIDQMAKPEEVIIVEDDNGEIVREQTKDTEVIAQYKTMRETIVFLTNLNYEDTEEIMLEKLVLQVTGGCFSWNGLNTLCWAIGSISGAMGEVDEKRFLVTVIKDLLKLCEEQRGKDNKAVVASNIMYIVGQYPRFLRAHWKFLKTVVNKLFEFMHEHHPGVQDMACDTFLKIAQKCKRKFMTPQVEDPQPFILTLISELQRHVADLQPHQVQAFYEAVGTMLSDRGPAIRLPRDEVMLRLMDSQNIIWKARMAEGAANVQALLQPEVVKELGKILRINTRVCVAAGAVYLHQLSNIFLDLLNVYKLYSEQVIGACAAQGAIATRLTLFKAMRGVKSEVLDLLIAFLEVCNSENPPVHQQQQQVGALAGTGFGADAAQGTGSQIFMATFMPSILNEVLADYRNAPPAARDPKVLALFSTSVCVLKDLIMGEIPRIMDAVFEKTLEMITTNMLDFPEHRINFFRFIREANEHCFIGLFSIPAHHQKLVVDSIVWAFKHTERNISETGLEILLELLQNISGTPQFAQPFYQTFMLPLLQDVFGVMTDRLHKSGFKQQAAILKHITQVVQSGQITLPLDPALAASLQQQQLPVGSPPPQAHEIALKNMHFVRDSIAKLLIDAFPNQTKAHIAAFVDGLFDPTMDLNAFKQHLRDFLVTIKEFEAEDNSDLFLEEKEANAAQEQRNMQAYMRSVPGLVAQADTLPDDDDI